MSPGRLDFLRIWIKAGERRGEETAAKETFELHKIEGSEKRRKDGSGFFNKAPI